MAAIQPQLLQVFTEFDLIALRGAGGGPRVPQQARTTAAISEVPAPSWPQWATAASGSVCEGAGERPAPEVLCGGEPAGRAATTVGEARSLPDDTRIESAEDGVRLLLVWLGRR